MPGSPLQDLPCFSIYAASRAIVQTYRSALAEQDLTYTQFLVLTALGRLGRTSVRELGDAMFLDSGTLSPVLRRMETRSLLSRERSGDDERVVLFDLTVSGRSTLDAATTAAGCLGPGYGFESAEEYETLLATLHRITRGMAEVTSSLRAEDSHPDPTRSTTPTGGTR